MKEFFGEVKLSEIAEELTDIGEQKSRVYAALGEKALPELSDNPEYATFVADIDELDKRVAVLGVEREDLLAAKERFIREQKEEMARRTCVKCSMVSAEGARFCEECGGKVGDLPREFCKSCCTLNYAGLKFCGECGVKLDELPPAAGDEE